MGQHLRFLSPIINFTCWLHVPRGGKMDCVTLEFVIITKAHGKEPSNIFEIE